MNYKKHLLFWSAVFIFLTLGFASQFSSLAEAFFFVSMLLPVVMATSYFFNQFLVPHYLLKAQYILFGTYTFYMIIVSLYLEMIVIMLSFIVLANYRADQMSPVSSDIFALTSVLYVVVLLFSFYQLVRQYLLKEKELKALEERKEQKIETHLKIRSNRQWVQLPYRTILYVESRSDYVHIYLADQLEPIVSKERISKLCEMMPSPFLRVHRSFCVNLEYVTAFVNDTLSVGKTQIPVPVSRTYKKRVQERLA